MTDLVVKIGTSSVTAADGTIDDGVIAALASDVATVVAGGQKVVVVTSGAITAGWQAVGRGAPRPSDAVTLQAVSAVGQPLLMQAWQRAFAEHDLAVGQVLLAPFDLWHRGTYLHARETLGALESLGVIPVVNENDAVADEEIRYGDNDRLAALVANLSGASRLVLLTDTSGLLTADPRLDPSATLIDEVAAIDADLESVAGASSSSVGSGGMSSKLSAARIATWAGVETVIAPARHAHPLTSALSGQKGAGTRFVARSDRMPARKAWIAFAAPSRGRVRVNDGAASALLGSGRSLLVVGVTNVEGDFAEGDAIDVLDETGALIAKGLARTGADDLEGFDGVLVHRDDLVVLQKR